MEKRVNQLMTTNKNSKKNDNTSDNKSGLTLAKNSTLLRLCNDLIFIIATFLDEDDVYNFEKCCPLFHQIINTLLYLRQSNNFKTFHLTLERLDQMLQKHNNFFKYSLSDTLVLSSGEHKENIKTVDKLYAFVEEFEKKWDKVRNSNNEWITNVLKSIKSLKFDHASSILLDILPVDILFNPNDSHLETIEFHQEFDHDHEKFGDAYLKFKQKFNSKSRKKNSCVKMYKMYG